MTTLALPYSTTAPWPGQDDGVRGRQMRGLVIAAVCPIEKVRIGYRVPSQSGNGAYVVIPNGDDEWMCSCPDYEARALECKHIYAVQYAIQREEQGYTTKDAEKPDVYAAVEPPAQRWEDKTALSAPTRSAAPSSSGPRTRPSRKGLVPATADREHPTYRQDWPSYNMAQKNEKSHFRHLLSDLTALVEEPQAGMGRRPVSLSDRIFSLVYKVYEGFSWRRFDTDLREAVAAGFITTAASTSSLARFMDNQALTPLLLDLVLYSALPLRPFETSFSIDATGFSTSRFDRWFDEKWGQGTATRDWVKLHLICGNSTHIITCAATSDRRDHDNKHFHELVSQTGTYFDMQEMSADKAYLDRKNLALVDGMGATLYTPFKSNTVPPRVNDHSAWARMYHRFMADYDNWVQHYHQRSNSESAISMVKRVFGDDLNSRNVVAQDNELLCKVIAHNLRVINQAMYERGLDPQFHPVP